MSSKNPHTPILILTLMMIFYATFFSAQLLLHHYTFGTRAMDVASLDQAVWNTSRGRPFQQTNNPTVNNRLGLHVEPILLPISLLYIIHSGPETLFIFESIVVALGAIPVFALARWKLRNDRLALLFGFIYLMFPAIQGANMVEFHPVTLAPTFLLATFYYLETNRPKLYALFAILAVSCKEDMSLLVLMIGLYAFFSKRQYRLGIVTVVLSLIWAYLAVFVIPPTFAGTQNIHWGRYSHLGDGALDIVLNLFREPKLFVEQLKAGGALRYIQLLLTPTAFTALLNPITLLLALPSLGINLLSNFSPMQEVNRLIYAAPLVPAVMISSIYGVANLKKWLSRGRFRLNPLILHPLLGLLLLVATLTYHSQYGFFPWGGQFRGWEKITDHHRRAEQILLQIPAGVPLSAQDPLVPHLSRREKIYIFDRVDDAEYIVFDINEDSWPLHPLALRQRIDQFLAGDYGVVAGFDGYLLLARNQANLPGKLPDAFFDFVRVPNPRSFRPPFPVSVVFDDKLRLLGYDIGPDLHSRGKIVVSLYWQALKPLEHDYALWPAFIDGNGNLIEDTSQRPLVTTIWYPTSRWTTDEIIVTRTLPRAFEEALTLVVGVAEEDWAAVSQRMSITQADDDLYTFEHKTWVRLTTFQQISRREIKRVTPPASAVQPQRRRQVVFGDNIHLLGADFPTEALEPGQALPFTLYWQSGASLSLDLTNFVHLLDTEGNMVAQLDWRPRDSLGYLPTTAWQPNRPVVDRQQLLLPDAGQLSPGQYRLILGWYNYRTGERLPVTANDDQSGAYGDSVLVGTLTVK